MIGYCTNVHAGTDLASIRENLVRYALPIRDSVKPGVLGEGDSLGVGLWIPNEASTALHGAELDGFRDFLRERRLTAFTINGFPFDNFHRDIVKHDVYLPTWVDSGRLEYTQRLATILASIQTESSNDAEPSVGSISTLPIGWGKDIAERDQATAGKNLRAMAKFLAELKSSTGRKIVLAIEPEPGCLLDTTSDCLAFFERHLPELEHREYVTVCHDICHAAVMMEDQRDVVSRLSSAGIGIGKVQVSSAITVDWESMANYRRWEALEQLQGFAEDRYLHQTGRRKADGGFELAEDLPGLLAAIRDQRLAATDDPVAGDSRWVIHFHVPIFLERFGHLTTTRDEVKTLLRTLDESGSSLSFTGHLEVETYAWTVLPEPMQKHGMAQDIASELNWLSDNLE